MSDTYLQAVTARANDKPADEELLELQRGTWATDRVGCVLAFAAFFTGAVCIRGPTRHPSQVRCDAHVLPLDVHACRKGA